MIISAKHKRKQTKLAVIDNDRKEVFAKLEQDRREEEKDRREEEKEKHKLEMKILEQRLRNEIGHVGASSSD